MPEPGVPDPAFVADITYTHRDRLDVRSSRSDRTLRSLGYFGDNFTGTEVAISPDGRDAYLQVVDPRFRIVRVDTLDGKRALVTDGYAPRVSPNSQLLGYITGGNDFQVLVRDLRSGSTRSIDLASLIDNSGDLFNGSMVWLAGTSTLAVLPADETVEALSSAPTGGAAPKRSRGCGEQSRSGCVILIHVPRVGPLRVLNRVIVPNLDAMDYAAIASDTNDQLILASDSNGSGQPIDVLSLTGSSASLRPLLTIPNATAEAFDSTGSHIIYSDDDHHPPRLFTAAISPHGLTGRRVLVPSAREVQVDGW